MFFKIIHKSEASYLCCYQKRRYSESIGRSFSTQYLRSKFFNAEDYSRWWKVSRLSKADQSKIPGNIIVIGKQRSIQLTGYHKTATLKEAFI